ncbi:MAG: ComEC/Rec2 family competence protein [Clostridium sp.]
MRKKHFKIYLSLLTIFLSLSFIGCSAHVPKDETSQNKPIINEQTNESNINSNNVESRTDSTTLKNIDSTELKVHFINTGNSDAILIQGEKTLLIDGGDNDDEKLVVDYIKKQNINTIDYLIATHPHADHIGGLDNVIDNLQVNNLFVANGDSDTATYKDFITSASNKGLSPSVPLETATFELSKTANFKVFNTNGGPNSNDQSLIVLLENGDDTLLFTGDAEKDTELEVLNKLPDIDLLKVSHHGSKTSTSSEFLNKVKPEYAVITVGKDNKYNHPHKSTMDKLKERNIIVHRTDECNNIIFTSTGKGLKTDCAKASYNFRDKEEKKVEVVPTKPSTPKKDNTTKKPAPSPNKPSTNNNNSNTATSPKPQDKMVWLSATGSKYHSKNNCGRMNPANATQVDLNTLSGYEACSKCF